MRRLILISVCCMSLTAFSQDVITTVSGENIKAKVMEVTDETVSYKKYHDQDGATFILKKEKITKIAWENGDVDEYNQTVATQQNNPSANPQPVLPYVTSKMGTFYLDNGLEYDAEQFKQFLMDNNLEPIWAKFSRGNTLFITGAALIGGGLALGVIGFTLAFTTNGDFGQYLTGMALGALGMEVAVLAGIPTIIVGAVRKKNAIRNYNAMYAGKPPTQYSQNVTYKIGLVVNGIGFSLNF